MGRGAGLLSESSFVEAGWLTPEGVRRRLNMEPCHVIKCLVQCINMNNVLFVCFILDCSVDAAELWSVTPDRDSNPVIPVTGNPVTHPMCGEQEFPNFFIPRHPSRQILHATHLYPILKKTSFELFNMGKKFGGASWLGSEDSTVRRLQYFLKNKWQRDENAHQLLARANCFPLPRWDGTELKLNCRCSRVKQCGNLTTDHHQTKPNQRQAPPPPDNPPHSEMNWQECSTCTHSYEHIPTGSTQEMLRGLEV
uniref:Uncharacterized protein n=1 Tax=Timema cristinae TaxID=61476 RepID=A0A7R9CMH4_TIMCR|nr:unnamed protein product [Timema cristinae]